MNKERIQKVAENMRAEGLEQILVTAPTSVFYLTGKWIAPGERMLALLVRGDGSSRLFANRLFALKGAVDADLKEFDDTDDPIALLEKDVRPGKLGVDKLWPSQFTIRLMDARPDVRPTRGSKPEDDARIRQLAQERFANWDCIYGANPKFNIDRTGRFAGGKMQFRMDIQKGVIRSAAVNGDFFSTVDAETIGAALTGCRYERGAVLEALRAHGIDGAVYRITAEEMAAAIAD